MPERLSEARMQQTILLYERYGVAGAAKRLGITPEGVTKRLDRAGVPKPHQWYRGAEAMERREAMRERRRTISRESWAKRERPARRDPLRSSKLVDEVEALLG